MIQFPEHKCGLYLQHNPHKDVYETVEQWLDNDIDDSEITPEDKAKAVETDELWTLQWYPDTPIGFYFVAAPTLERLLERANEE